MKLPLMHPISAPNASPTKMGTITGRSKAQSPKTALGFSWPLTNSVWPKDMTIMADAPTRGPDDRSIPPEIMTCVTPSAMIPMIDTCRMMIWMRATFRMVPSRFMLKSNNMLWPFMYGSICPSASKVRIIRMSAMNTFASFGQARLDLSYANPPVPRVFGFAIFSLRRRVSVAAISIFGAASYRDTAPST